MLLKSLAKSARLKKNQNSRLGKKSLRATGAVAAPKCCDDLARPTPFYRGGRAVFLTLIAKPCSTHRRGLQRVVRTSGLVRGTHTQIFHDASTLIWVSLPISVPVVI